MIRSRLGQFSEISNRLAFRAITLPVLTICVVFLQGCEQIGYYGQAVKGHLSIMSKQENIQELIDAPETETKLKHRLHEVNSALKFAEHNLGMPQALSSYRSFVQLDGKYPIWSVVATPNDSLSPRQWCYPFVGCASYRGYYAKQDAENYALKIQQEGNMDTHVGGADAYSTLGWFDDPVLSTFFRRDEIGLHALLFHELAHQVLYLKGDSTFNESFASAVEDAGVELWLKNQPNKLKTYKVRQKRSEDFLKLLENGRADLEAIYSSDIHQAEKLRQKQVAIDKLKQAYNELKIKHWDDYKGYDHWFSKPINNARLALVNTYSQWVPAFKLWILACDSNFPAFYESVALLSKQPKEERERVLNSFNQAASYREDAALLLCKYSPSN